MIDNETRAYIGNAATINSSQPGAHDSQAINIVATTDFQQVAFDGSLAIAGSGAAAPAVGVMVVDNWTEAFIDLDANVKAKGDIKLLATATSDVLLASFGLAGAGGVGFGGSVNAMDLETTTMASIRDGTIVAAGNSVVVKAIDNADVDVVTGGLGIGLASCIGAGVGVVMLDTTTTAEIGAATVDALANGSPTTCLLYTSPSPRD